MVMESKLCVMCGVEEKTTNHFFFKCNIHRKLETPFYTSLNEEKIGRKASEEVAFAANDTLSACVSRSAHVSLANLVEAAEVFKNKNVFFTRSTYNSINIKIYSFTEIYNFFNFKNYFNILHFAFFLYFH